MLDATITTDTTTTEAPVNAAPAADAPPVADTLLTGDQPAEGDAPAEQAEGDKPAEEAPAGAPEAYAEFAMPEGVAIDEEMLGEFSGVAKDLNLTQEAAQKVVDLAAKMRQADAAAIVQVRADWLQATQIDAEIGGDKLGENLATAKRGLEAYGSPALRELLNSTGLGNHPEVIRLLVKAGKTASEDTFVKGAREPAKPSRASILYPTSRKEQ
jgi:hypothetical protein